MIFSTETLRNLGVDERYKGEGPVERYIGQFTLIAHIRGKQQSSYTYCVRKQSKCKITEVKLIWFWIAGQIHLYQAAKFYKNDKKNHIMYLYNYLSAFNRLIFSFNNLK